jgi:hypothetical protein
MGEPALKRSEGPLDAGHHKAIYHRRREQGRGVFGDAHPSLREENPLGGPVPVDHAVGWLVQHFLDPASDTQVEIQADFQEFHNPALFRIVARHGREDLIPVKQVCHVEHALCVRVVGNNQLLSSLPVETVKCLGAKHQLGIAYVNKAGGTNDVHLQRLSRPGHLIIVDVITLPGD